ncbi:MAG: hypothetical protein IKV25_02685 [Clostridia bacterium]|nr:hypothetical protein [Clostridia bacterium]
MKKLTRLIALILCLCLCFSACKGKENVEESTTEPPEESTTTDNSFAITDGKVVLPYNKTDGINPFFAECYENIYLSMFIYEPLFSVDSNYDTTDVIADSIEINGKTATVRIKSNITCKGHENINAHDVVYSFNLAKASYYWGNNLDGITNPQVIDDYTVSFNLNFKDLYVAGKLDFPIVKKGTADSKTSIPAGSGKYSFAQDKLVSVADGNTFISLVEISNRESVEDALNIGMVDVFFSDLSDEQYKVSVGTTEKITLSNMVFLGLNSNRGALNKYIRSAIAAKIDSDNIALSSYQGHAVGVKLPIAPESTIAGSVTKVETKGNSQLANSIIDRCGYTRYSGSAKTNGAYTLALSLIVNKDNQFRVAAAYNIADSLKECGFLINVQVLSFADYSQRISSGNYDMYLGEIKLDGSMDISRFFMEGTKLSTGIDKSGKAATEYFKYRAGEITEKEYYEIFAEEYPFVPVVFRTGYTVLSSDINWLNLKQMPFNLYNGI